MRKITFLFLAIVAMVFSATKVSAQMPVASTDEAPVWYYIECGHNSDVGEIPEGGADKDKFIISDKDGRYAQLLTSRGADGHVYIDSKLPLTQKDAQLWRLEELEEEGEIYYYFINKAGGYLALNETIENYTNSNTSRYTIVDSEGDFYNYLYRVELVGSPDDEGKPGGIYCTIKDMFGFGTNDFLFTAMNVGAGFSLTNSAPYGAPVAVRNERGLVSNPRAWRFVPETELDDIFPTIIAEGETVGDTECWYNIKNVADGSFFLTTEDGETGLAEAVDADDLANYVFRLIQVKDKEKISLKIMNGNGAIVTLEGLNDKGEPDSRDQFTLRYAFEPLEGTESAQFYFSSYYIMNKNAYLFTAEGLVELSGKEEIYNTDKMWSFEPAEFTYVPNSVGNVNLDNVRVFVENGYVVVSGTDIRPEIYTATGAIVSADTRLAAGIYLVRIADKVEKVIVK